MILAFTVLVAILLFGVLGWLLFALPDHEPLTASPLEINKLLPVHCRHFPQVRQILSVQDAQFLRGRISKPDLKRWRAERNDVLRLYVQSLAQDFQHLQQFARLISAFAPELKSSQEFELATLAIRFGALYRLTMLRLALRSVPLPELSRLTEMVATLGLEMELFLDQVAARVPQVGAGSAA